MDFLLLSPVHLSYPSLCDPSITGCAEALQAALTSCSGGIAFYVDVDLVCPWEELSSGSPMPPS